MMKIPQKENSPKSLLSYYKGKKSSSIMKVVLSRGARKHVEKRIQQASLKHIFALNSH